MAGHEPIKLAVFFSGGGSTLQNLIDQIKNGSLPARIVWTLSSRENVLGIERSKEAGIPCLVLPRKDFKSHTEYSDAINKHLHEKPVDLIVLAGFMCLYRYPPEYHHRVMNIHPALIPAFCGKGMYGRRVHEAVLAAGAKVTGATVHFANDQYDQGPIILQTAVPVLDEDDPETLAHRVQKMERRLYPEAIRLFAERRLRVVGNKVFIEDRQEDTGVTES